MQARHADQLSREPSDTDGMDGMSSGRQTSSAGGEESAGGLVDRPAGQAQNPADPGKNIRQLLIELLEASSCDLAVLYEATGIPLAKLEDDAIELYHLGLVNIEDLSAPRPDLKVRLTRRGRLAAEDDDSGTHGTGTHGTGTHPGNSEESAENSAAANAGAANAGAANAGTVTS